MDIKPTCEGILINVVFIALITESIVVLEAWIPSSLDYQ